MATACSIKGSAEGLCDAGLQARSKPKAACSGGQEESQQKQKP